MIPIYLLFIVICAVVLYFIFLKSNFFVSTNDNGVNMIETININGAELYFSMKGNNKNNPILLVLHGGPGDASLPLVSKYNKELEENYTVVVLEQRGAGKSYYKYSDNEEINIDVFVEDTYQLSLYLLKRFSKEKLFITAHSWGSVIGMKFILKYPEIVYAYIGCGQVINMKKTTKTSFQYALDKNIEAQNEKVIDKLKEINYNYEGKDWFNELLFVTKEVVKNGGSIYNKTNYNGYIWQFIISKDYSFKDLIKRQKGAIQSIKFLWPELMTINFEGVTDFRVPVIFIAGRHDYHSSSKVVEDFYNSIDSEKQLFWFENSAHFPQWEENEKYNQIMIDLLHSENL